LTFSCKTRGFCPSCHAKRREEWGEWVRETLLLDVPHRQVVLTIPKALRIFFKFRRKLLGVYEADPLICPRCGGRMKVVSFLTEYAVVDRIIRHLELTFVAEKSPPAHVFEQVVLMAAEEGGDYE
jgi:Transposase zinc-binding domain